MNRRTPFIKSTNYVPNRLIWLHFQTNVISLLQKWTLLYFAIFQFNIHNKNMKGKYILSRDDWCRIYYYHDKIIQIFLDIVIVMWWHVCSFPGLKGFKDYSAWPNICLHQLKLWNPHYWGLFNNLSVHIFCQVTNLHSVTKVASQ